MRNVNASCRAHWIIIDNFCSTVNVIARCHSDANARGVWRPTQHTIRHCVDDAFQPIDCYWRPKSQQRIKNTHKTPQNWPKLAPVKNAQTQTHKKNYTNIIIIIVYLWHDRTHAMAKQAIDTCENCSVLIWVISWLAEVDNWGEISGFLTHVKIRGGMSEISEWILNFSIYFMEDRSAVWRIRGLAKNKKEQQQNRMSSTHVWRPNDICITVSPEGYCFRGGGLIDYYTACLMY